MFYTNEGNFACCLFPFLHVWNVLRVWLLIKSACLASIHCYKAHVSLTACSGDEGSTAATSYQARAIQLGQDQNIQMPLEVLFCLTDLELILWSYHN